MPLVHSIGLRQYPTQEWLAGACTRWAAVAVMLFGSLGCNATFGAIPSTGRSRLILVLIRFSHPAAALPAVDAREFLDGLGGWW